MFFEGLVSNEHRTQNYDSGKTCSNHLMSKQRNDVIDVITQKLRLKYELKYNM